MESVKVNIEDVKPYIDNPRNNDKAVNDVAESIRQCGYIAPIVCDENMVILAGHTRDRALKMLGYKEIDVLIRRELSEDQKRKFRILDNRTAELSNWNYEKLQEELEGLDFDDFDFGFSKLVNDLDQAVDSGFEFDMEDFDDESFKHECPECGFRFN